MLSSGVGSTERPVKASIGAEIGHGIDEVDSLGGVPIVRERIHPIEREGDTHVDSVARTLQSPDRWGTVSEMGRYYATKLYQTTPTTMTAAIRASLAHSGIVEKCLNEDFCCCLSFIGSA